MSSNPVERRWEERVVSEKRIMHYLLRDTTPNSILAVVGKQRRSARHMIYQVTKDYLRVFGSTNTVHAGTEWKSKDKVEEFLQLVTEIGGPIIAKPDEQQMEAAPHLKPLLVQMTKFSQQMESQNSEEIVWSGDAYICRKQLKHYTAFCWNDTNILVHSMVWALDKDRVCFIGYVKDLYENDKGEKRVQLVRFLSREEAEGLIPAINAECREVFISSKEEDISANDIDGLATVLAPSHFKKCDEVLPLYMAFKCFMCRRQIESENDVVSPFTISKLPGYSGQPIFSALESDVVESPRSADGGMEERLKPCVQVNINVELLSQDSGLRGCWFRCKVLRSSKNRLKVQYYDIEDAVTHAKIEEWVPGNREAGPDNMGLRRSGRLRVRPWPHWNTSNAEFEVGAAVDAWWCNGWWEGFITGFDTSKLQIYLPGEKRSMAMERNDVRISKEWVDTKWVDLSKPDTLSVIRSMLGLTPKVEETPEEAVNQPSSSETQRSTERVFGSTNTVHAGSPIIDKPDEQQLEAAPHPKPLADEQQLEAATGSSTASAQNLEEIVWSGDAYICGKQLKHYQAFVRNDTNILVQVNSMVWALDKDRVRFIGYVKDLYENDKGEKRVLLVRFLLREEAEGLIPEINAERREVFISSKEEYISANGIDGLATVLAPSHFEVLPVNSPFKPFMCRRQIESENDVVSPFTISKLPGYSGQPVFSALESDVVESPRSADGGMEERLKPCVQVNINVELLSQDSGLGGCWFRCKVLRSSKNRLKVQYYDIEDAVTHAKIEEWVPGNREAGPDNMGLRRSGRLRVRPWPHWNTSNAEFEVGAAVDAWWCNGWWEGFITGFDTSKLQIYLPGEKRSMAMERNDVRISKEWVDTKWVDLSKPDTLSVIRSMLGLTPKVEETPEEAVNQPSSSETQRSTERVFGSTNTVHAGSPIIDKPDEQQLEAAPHPKPLADEQQLEAATGSSTASAQNLEEIVWSGDAYICGKQLKHYQAFVRNDTNILVQVNSMVWALDKDRVRFIGYVKDLYENDKGEKRVLLVRFLLREEAEGLIPEINAERREVFISSKEEYISANGIDGLATVLAPSHFEVLPVNSPFKPFMCRRQIESENDVVSPFTISKLPGYSGQPVFSALESDVVESPRSADGGMEERLKPCVQVNINVELLSQDSGLRGCWFRCKVLRSSKNRLKVQYYDIEDAVTHAKIEEWVPGNREAGPDNMGLRRSGRLRVRPWPHWNTSNAEFEVGAAVDAWWCNGWWEGFITGFDTSKLQIYLPGEKRSMAMERNDVRISKEWVDTKWVDLSKPDTLSVIRSMLGLTPKVEETPEEAVNQPSSSETQRSTERVFGSTNTVHAGSPIIDKPDEQQLEAAPHPKPLADEQQLEAATGSSTASAQNLEEIVWSGDAYICGKQLKHYQAFVRNDTNILVQVNSMVWALDKDRVRFIGYVKDLYENDKGEKRVLLVRFLLREEAEGLIPEINAERREVFISSKEEYISANGIDGLATVLAPSHFEVLPVNSPFKPFMCRRQIESENDVVSPFTISKLPGYSGQPVFSALESDVVESPRSADGGMEERLKPCVQVNINVELLSQDSGLRGCWFRCKVLRSSKNRLKVQYYDIEDAVTHAKIEEWVPGNREAGPDNMGLRRSGRLRVRPWPHWNTSNAEFEVGAAVDAWWCNGWWEGFITGFDTSKLQIYLPGEKRSMAMERNDVRISKEWVDTKWVDLSKPDTLSVIRSMLGLTPKVEETPEEAVNQPSSSETQRSTERVFGSTNTVHAGSPIIDKPDEQQLEAAPHPKPLADEQQLEAATGSSTASAQNLEEIVWSGDAYICGKQLKHYQAFVRNDTNILVQVNSMVWALDKDRVRFIGYVKDLYENDKGEKRVLLVRFLLREEAEGLIPEINAERREVFISSKEEYISANGIDGLATVLAPSHFEVLPVNSPFKPFMCRRQIESENDVVSPFTISKLPGYSGQPVFSALESDVVESPRSADGGMEERLKPCVQVNINVELLSQDSGLRGCWFRCKVLRSSKNRLKVQYYDIEDAVTHAKIEEWVPGNREAGPDNMGLRRSGRLRVRPWPHWNTSNAEFEVGAAVDAWWCNGWWEGFITGFDTSKLQIYLPGEKRSMAMERNDVRISKEWVDTKWVDLSKPDTLSVIRSMLGLTPKVEETPEEAVNQPSSSETQRSTERVFGSTNTVHAGSPIIDKPDEQQLEAAPHPKPLADEQQLEAATGSSTASAQNLEEIVWSGDAYICGKQLKHYQAFVRNDTNILVQVNSMVWALDKDRVRFIGYVKDLYENDKGEKRVLLVRFLLREEAEGLIPEINAERREVFISSKEEYISANGIDGLATVLAPSHFEVLPVNSPFKPFMCRRQIESENDVVSPFTISKLPGYSGQPVFSALESDVVESPRSADGGMEERLKPCVQVNINVELLSQDSGLRGCWFRCKVLRSSKNRLKVQYYDIEDAVTHAKIEEWVPGNREAGPDNMGLRRSGRLRVRPWPHWNTSNAEFEVGAAVDAWWCNGWWEGFITGFDTSKLQIYLPGEKRSMAMERNDVRISKEWVDTKWVDLSKPDTLSVIRSMLGLTPKVEETPEEAVNQPSSSETQRSTERVFGSTNTVHAGSPIIDKPDEQQLEAAPHPKPLADEQQLEAATGSSTASAQNLEEIVWSGDAYICGKQLKHYQAFVRNDTNILVQVNSMVWALDKDRVRFIGYVKDLYENDKGEKRVLLVRFLLREEAEGLIPEINAERREVFISSKEEYISANGIDGLATVLAPSHFEVLPVNSPFKPFMCRRQIESENDVVSPFTISKLPGYSGQPVFSALESDVVESPRSADGGMEERLKPCVQVNINVELLSQDSGLRGCWFRCKVLRSSKNRLKVQYYDIEDAVTHAKIEEWVPGNREAGPDNMGLRRSGRLRVRPWPHWNTSNAEFEVGAAVDAWWCNGWWEGFITGFDTSKLQIYLPGEKRSMAMERNDVRISKEWVDTKWVDLSKPDTLSVIRSMLGLTPKVEETPEEAVNQPSSSETQRSTERVFGSTNTVHAGSPIIDKPDEQQLEAAPHPKPLADEQQLEAATGSSTASAQNLEEIVWSGDAYICGKQLKHYQAFVRIVQVHSMVWALDKDRVNFIGYVKDLYENDKGEKRVLLVRFLLREEAEGLIPEINAERREVFISSKEEDISANDIDGLVTVLAPSHFEKCDEVLPVNSPFKCFMCRRQIESENDVVSPFTISKLPGYSRQPIFSALESDVVEGPRSADGGMEERLKPCVQVNINVELLSQDIGMRGCWFRCKVLRSSKNRLKVQYYDIEDAVTHAKIEEWVPGNREAGPDNMGLRRLGRLRVRPWPHWNTSKAEFGVGAAVDAWWCNGWWEGFIIGLDTSKLQIYLPGEKMFITMERKDVRISKEWVDTKWVDLSKPDTLSVIKTLLGLTPKVEETPEEAANQQLPSSSESNQQT